MTGVYFAIADETEGQAEGHGVRSSRRLSFAKSASTTEVTSSAKETVVVHPGAQRASDESDERRHLGRAKVARINLHDSQANPTCSKAIRQKSRTV
jgi:hypothetical protein